MVSPEEATPPIIRGASLRSAFGAVVMLHGRGATPDHILTLYPPLQRPGYSFVAPAATGLTWYPHGFMSPIEANEPSLSQSLATVRSTMELIRRAGIPTSRVILLGFSQGACLAAEFMARNPERYGGLAAFTGGLIGPPGGLTAYEGSLEDTPVFLGSGDPDPHVPWSRVQETADVLRDLGGRVTLRRYPGMPHTVCEDQIIAARALLDSLSESIPEEHGSP